MSVKVVFHDPLKKIRLKTANDPLALMDGEWYELTNTRLGNGVIQCRYGTSSALGTISTASYRGHFVGKFNSANTIFVATREGSATKVYSSTDGATFTEITAASGAYGNTRFTTDERVSFAITQDQYSKLITPAGVVQDTLVFGIPSESPRVYSYFYGGGGAGTGGFKTAIIEAISALTKVRTYKIIARPTSDSAPGLQLEDSGITVRDTGDITASVVSTEAPVITVGTAVVANDYGVVADWSGRTLLASQTLLIGIDSQYGDFLNSFKINVGNEAAGVFTSVATIWNPSTGEGQVDFVPLGNTTATLYSFDAGAFFANSSTSCNAIQFVFVGTTPTVARSFKLFLVCPGPQKAYANPGGTLWAVTAYNVGSHTESPPVVISVPDTPAQIFGAGGKEVPLLYRGMKIPNSEVLYFQYLLPAPNPSSTAMNKGVEALRYYRKRVFDGAFLASEGRGTATYSGAAWSLVSGSASDIRVFYGTGQEALVQLEPPSAYHIPLPKPTALGSGADRVYVGSQSSGQGRLYFSGRNNQFRYLEVATFDQGQIVDDSPGMRSLEKDIIHGFATVASSLLGANTTYVFGEGYVYQFGGFTTGQLMQVASLGVPGTVSPGSIAIGRDTVFYLDRERQVRRLTAGDMQVLSLSIIDNNTKAIPGGRVDDVTAVYFGERYYLCYTPSGGGTNTRILVWSDYFGGWESIDTPPKAFEGILSWYDASNGRERLIALGVDGSDLKSYEYDYSGNTQDLGSNIAVTLTTYALHNPNWQEFWMGQVAMVCDPVSGGGTIAVTRLYYPNGGTATNSIALPSGSVPERVSTYGAPSVTTKGAGGACRLSVTMTVRGGWACYNLESENEGLGENRKAK